LEIISLEEKLKNLPDSPGVYQYFDENHRLLYVGKAKSLKNRVKSYFRFTPDLGPSKQLSLRITKMINEVVSLETILVETENDALILENSLIKQLKPKYNILLRDDKTYPYIYIDMAEKFPRFEITRKVIRGKEIKYFGPFATGGRAILDSIYELFPLVQKKSCLNGTKACLFHQIERCLAPCEGLVSQEAYLKIVQEASGFINQKKRLVNKLSQKMMLHAENLHFEEAQVLKERIGVIESASLLSGVDLAKMEDFDVLALKNSGDHASAVRFFIRSGKLVSSSHTTLKFSFGFDSDEAYKRAFLSFYQANIPVTATTIYVGETFAEQEEVKYYLEQSFKKRFEIIQPKKGKKLDIVNLALKNAEELLKTSNKIEPIYDEVAGLFSLESRAYRIECFDNSHISGQANVGAMIVWDEEGFVKADYRNYHLESKTEYEQMRETLTRRVESFLKNPVPDLWVIDGGKALCMLAEDILMSVGVSIPVIGIAKEKVDAKAHRAKGAAKDILYFKEEIFKLSTSDKRLQFFQRLRDSAHNHAITFHRKTKRKEDKKIDLLNVKGIGPAKIKRLIDFFGTFEAIQKADEKSLATALNSTDAKKIIDFFSNSIRV
jgi:excinuclease ABC subunit C